MIVKKIFLITVILFFGLVANGLTIEDNQPLEGLSKNVSLDLRGMDIIDMLKFLSQEGDLNMVATKNVQGRVTLFLKDVTIADVLDIILLTNNLACEEKGNIITVMTDAEYEALYGTKYTDKRQSKIITLQYADVAKVGEMLNNLASAIGKVIVDEVTGTIILLDNPEKIKEMKEAAQRVDIPTVGRVIPKVTETFELKYAKVADIKDEISKALTENVGDIKVDERTNKIVVTDLLHNMGKIRELIAAFDAKTMQVYIEARIIEITLDDDFSMGIDWQKVLSSTDNLTLTGSYAFSAPSSTTSYQQVSVGTLAADNYTATLKAIQYFGKTSLLSAPHIAVTNNQEAKFMVGSREAYVITTTTTGEATATTSESVQFIDVGVQLYVTPTINKDGFVKMHIKPEISSVSSYLETGEGNQIPIVDTSNVETDVLIKDGTTIIIAGLVKEQITKAKSKLPVLGDIPILGEGFKKRSDTIDRKELVIFLTPHIITGEHDQFDTKE